MKTMETIDYIDGVLAWTMPLGESVEILMLIDGGIHPPNHYLCVNNVVIDIPSVLR